MAVQARFCYENMGLPLPILPSFEAGFSLQEFPSQQNAQSLVSMAVSQPLDAQLEIQRQELDCFLQLRNERLRYALRKQRNEQLGNLLKIVESKALYLLTRKEEDLARATNKRMELEACLREVERESKSWQRLAEANESTAMDLSKRLEQAKDNAVEDEESCNNDQQQDRDSKMACKQCNSKSSCVLFLPCRHLCSCKSCEPLLVSCPVCKSVKEGSVKVFLA
ncbi:hypothetical protein F3Y22_tig00110458pilonHSYRG00243 [Hibiscus syriacus]|uniref:RING-type domain-containing protein n=1 Tax=Hibiscus syriacus TaxID=106335 RepID=A0A6A3AK31_HIBSY|nr:probable BOI-related E3 ubiquitin-protein ligase 2 [Hibiscus syriacus]KAE8704213.1 hypothetical protein F3Y22_tig00110458pilonHSYRG00243 [Hibiscus syriacus]